MAQFKLNTDHAGLFLSDTFSNHKPLRVKFDTPEFIRRTQQAGKRSELVARSVKARPGLRVLDCTGGLGRDAFILASLGCVVTLAERSRIMALMLDDGLRRARSHPELRAAANRMVVTHVDATLLLNVVTTIDMFDVVYIDPMFPAREKSAKVKGEMQQMQNFLGKDQDANRLVEMAIAAGYARVVLKRPGSSDWHPPRIPTHVFTSKTSRFEVYVP